ncbi:HAD family hydrolase [Salegentibacter salegens]|uniref:phosphoglycolate phosphatase n=1 Tax=Salegentibacter salegens TaxID=143223 RepID=A0A1M7HD42_9FLAO|nr:HAD hydrolase-like protein [Salegentibacter salegens]PRX43497.1 phosphoglycolate phosphatase-like HAD superfamily hydrolase [Salegentibacter salegens]SHM26451.1 Phosphoglycolate phosphatase, HAD superfamily [Salegentibacter salegens]
MINLKDKKNIFWDFDGVIMDSMPIRNKGFELVLENYPKDQVQALMKFHLKNGGLSRYVKFRHFFEEIRGENVSEEEVKEWAQKFSKIMKKELVQPPLLIKDSLNFIKENYRKFNMHIVSGSDGMELNYLCERLEISWYFISIHGSPVPKKELVHNLLIKHKYKRNDTILIGDSINDYEAAESNDIDFGGYNNERLKELKTLYIESFT